MTVERDGESVWSSIETRVKAHPPMGCGNYRCSKGCKGEYYNVPNPHSYPSFWLTFEHDDEHGWRWEAEGCGVAYADADLAAVLAMVARYAAIPLRSVDADSEGTDRG